MKLWRTVPLALSITGTAPVSAASPSTPVYMQAPTGFVSAKGERALVMGYPETGLELWAYPLQLASDYRLRFRVPDRIDPLDAAPLLVRTERRATEAIRVYVGPDFAVRERLFVPRQGAGVLLRYEVEGRPDVRIEASFRPSLDLMWPAALGGQTIGWNPDRNGYVEREPLHGFSATIASPEAIAHDAILNRARPVSERLTLLLQPKAQADGTRVATLAAALDPADGGDGAAATRAGEAQARMDAEAHAAEVLDHSLLIVTGDPAVDDALRSATLALDQAWACNDRLGCGMLAGFGPSRAGRRPQYAWFFGGDGLVATDAMVDTGQFARARDELAFILRYQDPKTGMIWHELSQSAALIDWAGRYPYMYVHVDISFQFLATLAHYVTATGDVGFARDHWPAIARAWAYCLSTIDARTGLPRIPEGKQGQNEQDKLRDDIRLSSLWIDAADGYAALATAAKRPTLAETARRDASRARAAIDANDWDSAHDFWLSGHTLAGQPISSQRADAIGVLDQGAFKPDRVERALDRLASPDFLTDWGMRSVAASDPGYDPNLYSAGSVWGLGTAAAAQTFWRRHRPLIGWRLWRGLAEGDTLDSAGHLHEVLAGDLYHPELESVPEQTWSSAGLISAAVHGLLGLEVDAATRSVTFAPHLAGSMETMTIRHVRVGAAELTLSLHRTAQSLELSVDNSGPAIRIRFSPELPLAARAIEASAAGARVDVTSTPHAQDTHATIMFTAGPGATSARIRHEGGITLKPVVARPLQGDRSAAPICSGSATTPTKLLLSCWSARGSQGQIEITSQRRLRIESGGNLTPIVGDRYRLTLGAAFQAPPTMGYERRLVIIDVDPSTRVEERSFPSQS